MYKIVDEPKEEYIPIYVNVESADSQQEFWQKLFHALLDEDFIIVGQRGQGKTTLLRRLMLAVEKNKKLLLIDNIDELLGKLKEKEQRQLREILIYSSTFRIIGGSTKMIEQHYDYGQPFYEFFQIIRLQGLNKNESVRFLKVIGDESQRTTIKQIIKDSPQRIETLRRITGGVPRTIVMLFDIFIDDEGNAFEDLLRVLDEAPLYKHRMDDLPTTLQDIAHVIAMNWDGLGTKDIALKTRLKSKEVSTQLKQLENKYGIIESTSIGKNKIYKLEERFFNICYLMRFGRKKDRQKVEWLVRFLNSWCSLKAIEAGDIDADNALSWLYFEQGVKLQDAIHYAQSSYNKAKKLRIPILWQSYCYGLKNSHQAIPYSTNGYNLILPLTLKKI